MVTYLGETDILKNMCEKFNIPTGSVYNYMYSHNYECNINEAFEYCVKHYKPIVRPKVGDKIGSRTILEYVESNTHHTKVKVKCNCGQVDIIQLSPLILGKADMCSKCARKLKNSRYKGGISKYSWYGVYKSMLRRCYNPKDKKYKDYGERGIRVCDEWLDDPWEFGKWAEANGYIKGLHIDRKDNDGNYEPSNCWWVPNSINVNNRRNTIFVTVCEEVLPLSVACRKYNLNYNTVKYWAERHNCTYEEAFMHYLNDGVFNDSKYHKLTYNGEILNFKQWSDKLGINLMTIRERYRRGLPVEDILYKGNLKHKHFMEKKNEIQSD